MVSTAAVSSTDLGRKWTNTFDYGSRQTTSFDYGNKGTDVQGWHDHAAGPGAPGGRWGDWISGTDNDGNYGKFRTDGNGNHGHTVYIGAHDHWVGIGAHNHFIDMGAHGHSVTIEATGNAENTVKNIAFNYIVRLA